MALDSGIAKMGIFSFILLIAFAGLISIIPAEYNNTITYGNPLNKVPNTWNGIELGGYNFTESYNTTLTITIGGETFDIGGRNLLLDLLCTTVPYRRELQLQHQYGFGLLWKESMDWYNADNENKGSLITYSIFNEDFEEFENLEYEVICLGLGSGSSYFKITSLLSFNITLYETPEEAWNNDDLDILFGINPENTNYQQDIWYLISNVLTFNTYYVFGTTELFAIILNGIIASFVYANIIIFATAIILEVLPF